MNSSKLWFVYILRTVTGALYTGITNDVERRVAEHQSGGLKGAKALRGKGPLVLVYVEEWATKSAALKREYAIKQLSKAQKEQLISDGST